jgi:pimeloyl-ACP methyl ester carboxylesterase
MRVFAQVLTTTLVAALALAASPAWSRPPAQTGEFVSVTGGRIHALKSGTGPAIVVFVSGMGEDLSTWSDVQPIISKRALTISYDRFGLGTSDPAPDNSSRSLHRLAAELHDLLAAMHVDRPVILVGHSLGGAIIQVYAHDFRDGVAGLVLVDPEDGRLIALEEQTLPADLWEAHQRAVSAAVGSMTPAQRRELDAGSSPASGDEVAQSLPLPRVPCVLLTGTKKNPEFPGNPVEQDLKLRLHAELAHATPGMMHWMVASSRHYIQNDAPAEVIRAIDTVVSLAR